MGRNKNDLQFCVMSINETNVELIDCINDAKAELIDCINKAKTETITWIVGVGVLQFILSFLSEKFL